MKTADKRQLMKRAWQIHRETRKSLSECVKRAYDLARLAVAMKEAGPVYMVYTKINGERREAIGTLNIGPAVFAHPSYRRMNSPKVFTYWDLKKCEFRCFRIENLVSWHK